MHAMDRQRTTLVSKHIIRGGLQAPKQYLTGPDLFSGMVTVPLFYTYPQGLDVERMMSSLAELLRSYPLAAGRLRKDSAGYAFIDPDDSGVPFSIYDVDGPMPPYGPDYPHQRFIRRYYQAMWPWTAYRAGTPLLSIRVYRYTDGGAICTMAPAHCLIDGSSIWMLVQDWARLARGEGAPEPIAERALLLNRSHQFQQMTYRRQDVQQLPALRRWGLYLRLAGQALGNRLEIFQLPGRYLDALREAYEQEFPDGPAVSDVDLITARCLKTIAEVRRYRQGLCVGLVVDLRFKRDMALPKRLFGNAIGQEEREFCARDLASLSVAGLARKLRQPEVRPGTEDWQGYLGFMERMRRNQTIGQLLPRSVRRSLDGGFMQNNYCALPVYDADFGTGRPSWYTPVATPFRMVKIVPTAGEDNSVDLHLILGRRDRRAFQALFTGI